MVQRAKQAKGSRVQVFSEYVDQSGQLVSCSPKSVRLAEQALDETEAGVDVQVVLDGNRPVVLDGCALVSDEDNSLPTQVGHFHGVIIEYCATTMKLLALFSRHLVGTYGVSGCLISPLRHCSC